MRIIALIPARKGSQRVPGKNMVKLGGITLLRRAIRTAQASGLFETVLVSTNWSECVEEAAISGTPWISRPDEISQDDSHDYQWVKHALDEYTGFDIFVILRPTSPFRRADTIRRAVAEFLDRQLAHSMRAVEPTKHHPGKSWEIEGNFMSQEGIPGAGINPGISSFDLPTQALTKVYCQNGCIHVAWTSNLEEFGNVSGNQILPFFTQGDEGIDINTPEDLQYAGWLMDQKQGGRQ